MRYFVEYDSEKNIIGFGMFEYENQTMTEVSEQEYYQLRAIAGFDDSAHWREKYESLTVMYIREKYSSDDEYKLIREYLADNSDEVFSSAFLEYNSYVENCKAKARMEVYGE